MTPEFQELIGYIVGYGMGAFGVGYAVGLMTTVIKKVLDQI
jgi:hypothetical protein